MVARGTVDPDTWQQTVSVCYARWKSSTLARAITMLNWQLTTYSW